MDMRVKSRDRANRVDRHVGMRMRMRRRSLGLSQGALADVIGLTFQQVQKYERGANRVSASKLWEIGHALKVGPSYFFEGLDGGLPDGSSPDGEDVLQVFMALPETHELVTAYLKIPRGPLRRQLFELIRVLAETRSRR